MASSVGRLLPIGLARAVTVFRTVTAAFAALSVLSPAADIVAKAAVRTCQHTQYTVLELPFLPYVISPTGVVAGITERHRAILWHRESGARELPVPEGFHYTEPVGITRSGAIVINAFDAAMRKHRAFVYSNGSFLPLAGNQTFGSFLPLAGNQTLAHGLSPMGLVVGEWVPEGQTTSEAVYWNHDVPHPLGFCCGGTLKAANRAAEMIGDAYDEQRHYHAFAWSQTDSQRTLGPTSSYSSAVAINDSGHILLQVGPDGYLDQSGHPRRLDLSTKFYNNPRALNNCDFVVGGYGPDSDHYHGFLWTPAAGFQDLNSLIRGDSGWTLKDVTGINDRGEMVGRGDFHHDDTGFLLVPGHGPGHAPP